MRPWELGSVINGKKRRAIEAEAERSDESKWKQRLVEIEYLFVIRLQKESCGSVKSCRSIWRRFGLVGRDGSIPEADTNKMQTR